MNQLIKKGFLLGVILLLAGNAWAFPVAGDQVKMWSYNNLGTGEYTEHYEMEMVSSGKFYNTFCVEKNEYFSSGGKYTVSSVELYATNGGGSEARGATWNTGLNRWEDMVRPETMWLYASYFNGLLGPQSYALAEMVQNAIWYLEEEFFSGEYGESEAQSYWDDRFKTIFDSSDKTFAGWNIQVVNLVDRYGKAQSQLVGAPVPEPATMVLFGIGLLGLASFGRKKLEKQ